MRNINNHNNNHKGGTKDDHTPSYSELMQEVNKDVHNGETPIVQSRYSIAHRERLSVRVS